MNSCSIIWVAIVNGQIVQAMVWGFGDGGGGDDQWWWFALPLWMVMSMMHDDGDDLHCHCGWWCWWCWWWWRWFADGEDNHHWCRPPKRTLHSFTAGTLLPPTSQLQMTSTPRNILLEILGYISSNWRGVQRIADKVKLSFTRLNIQAKMLNFCST